MRPTISESSYGPTLTFELPCALGQRLTAAPIFPSLYKEGQPGGGYDVKLEMPGIFLFLQFKLSHYMVGSNAKEAILKNFNLPFYRIPLLPKNNFNQHQMLFDREGTGDNVYYTAPEFHTVEEFDFVFKKKEVCERSRWIKPSSIGPLPGKKIHHVSFSPKKGSKLTLFSEPKVLDTDGSFENFKEDIHRSLKENSDHKITEDKLQEKVRTTEEIIKEHHPNSESVLQEKFSDYPLKQLSFYSQVFFGSQLCIIQNKSGKEIG